MALPVLPNLGSLGLGLDFGDQSHGGNVNNQWNFGTANAWPFSAENTYIKYAAYGVGAIALFFVWRKYRGSR